jgi:hypothetical protein
MHYLFHPDAEIELTQAIDYYEQCSKGLGQDFTIEVHATIERIITYPKAWSVIDEEIRRALVKRFPYGVLYAENNTEIFIIAVMNLHREPDYWKYRYN